MRERYERILRKYFEEKKFGTVYDIIAWMKSRRVKKSRANKPSSYDRGLLIPSVGQVTSLVKRVGARNMGIIRLRSHSEVILWGVDFQ